MATATTKTTPETTTGASKDTWEAREAKAQTPCAIVNEVTLVGRVSVDPESRELPSGDTLVTFRLIVPRPRRRRAAGGVGERSQVDVIDVACWSAASRRAALRLSQDQMIRVEGSLHRRFFRAGGGAASRYEVEARSIKKS